MKQNFQRVRELSEEIMQNAAQRGEPDKNSKERKREREDSPRRLSDICLRFQTEGPERVGPRSL